MNAGRIKGPNKGHRNLAGLLRAALVSWAIIVIAVFYALHDFELALPLIGLAGWGGNLLFVGALGILAIAWGRSLLRWVKVHTSSHLESLLFGAALGHGLLATIILILGLVGWLHRPIVLGTTAALGLGALPEIRRLLQEWRQRGRAWACSLNVSWSFDTFLSCCLGLSLLMGLMMASLPPTSRDALIVHLIIPRELLSLGRISSELGGTYAVEGRPMFQHMLFTWGIALGGDIIPKLLHFSFGLYTVLTIYALTRRYLNSSPLLASTLFYTAPVVQMVTPWAYVDMGVTFYTTITVYALLNWSYGRGTRWGLLAVLSAAWSAQVKNNGWFIMVFTVGMAIYKLARARYPWRQRAQVAAGFCLVGLLASCPWLIASSQVSGQPLLAFQKAASKVRMDTAGSQMGLQRAVSHGLQLLALPWWMTMQGTVGGYPGEVTPLFLLFLPIWALLWQEGKAAQILISCAVIEFLLWIVGSRGNDPQNRLLMPVFPLASILASRALERLKAFESRLFSSYHFMRLITIGVLLTTLLVMIRYTCMFHPGSFLLRIRSRSTYLAYVLDHFYPALPYYYSAVEYINDTLPTTAKVGILRPETRGYYLARPYVITPFKGASSPEEMWKIAQTLELTHVLVSRSGLEFEMQQTTGSTNEPEGVITYVNSLHTFLQEHGELLHDEHGACELYALIE